MMLLDQIALQHKRLQLRIGDDILKTADMRHHLLDLDALIPAALKILPHPVLETDRLAYINDMILLIMHDVNTGSARQLL